MLYSCPSPECVRTLQVRAEIVAQELDRTPNNKPTYQELARRAIDLALTSSAQDQSGVVQDMRRAAALLILACEAYAEQPTQELVGA